MISRKTYYRSKTVVSNDQVMRSFRLLTVAVLAVALMLSSVGNAYASQWIQYDTGPPFASWGISDVYWGVEFSLPAGWSSAMLLTARVTLMCTLAGGCSSVMIYLLDSDGVTLIGASPYTVSVPWTSSECQFFDASPNVVVSQVFWIVMKSTQDPVPFRLCYTSEPGAVVHSYTGSSLPPDTPYLNTAFAFRAEVEQYAPPSAAPVGGFVEPTNKLAVFTPYLAVFGIVGAAVAIIVWKRPEN